MNATSHLAPVSVDAKIVAIRLHARRPPAGSQQSARVEALLDLGQREAQRRAAAQALVDLTTAAKRVVEQVPDVVRTRLDEVAGLAVELGLQIARELVGNALDRGFVDPTEVVVRCLRDCVHGSDRSDLVVRVHPDDLTLVQQQLERRPEVADELLATRFVADATVPRGGVRAETDTGRLRYDPRDALERVCAEVRREVSA
ncbi:MAG TPA: FliH/SctL family protein [Planctomycetota bacterium]|nr:FliH/SctL family protein [Planctomycetota bacterium]